MMMMIGMRSIMRLPAPLPRIVVTCYVVMPLRQYAPPPTYHHGQSLRRSLTEQRAQSEKETNFDLRKLSNSTPIRHSAQGHLYPDLQTCIIYIIYTYTPNNKSKCHLNGQFDIEQCKIILLHPLYQSWKPNGPSEKILCSAYLSHHTS